VRLVPVALLVLGSVLGFGLVVNTDASWLSWQGYLLGPFGLGGKSGTWESANLGVIVALVAGFAGWLVLGRGAVRRQEASGSGESSRSGPLSGKRPGPLSAKRPGPLSAKWGFGMLYRGQTPIWQNRGRALTAPWCRTFRRGDRRGVPGERRPGR
jgi:hypothetical protein